MTMNWVQVKNQSVLLHCTTVESHQVQETCICLSRIQRTSQQHSSWCSASPCTFCTWSLSTWSSDRMVPQLDFSHCGNVWLLQQSLSTIKRSLSFEKDYYRIHVLLILCIIIENSTHCVTWPIWTLTLCIDILYRTCAFQIGFARQTCSKWLHCESWFYSHKRVRLLSWCWFEVSWETTEIVAWSEIWKWRQCCRRTERLRESISVCTHQEILFIPCVNH